MEYQQLPPVSMIIGSPANSAQHVINGSNNQNGSNQLLTMQPPLIPLQVAHNLHQLTSHNSQNNVVHHGNNNQNPQALPPTTQLLQAIHNNTQHQQQQNNVQNIGNGNNNGTTNNNNNSNNNNNVANDENNRWSQFNQVQQLWRHHHAYLNGNAIRST
jgi:hypothetical protein